MACDRDAPICGEGVPGDHRSIARVQKGDVPGCMARSEHYLEASHAVAIDQPEVWRSLEFWPRSRQLPVHDVLACVNAGVELGHEHLHQLAQALLQRVQRADMIAVAVG